VEHEERADELIEEADRAGQASEKLKEDIGQVKSDWESKKGDAQVPGAVDEEQDEADEDGD
jgi:hypothetical protein